MPTIQTIGFDIDITKGRFVGTQINNGVIELLKLGTTYDGANNVYQKNGYWESEVIDTIDRYKSLNNLAIGSLVSNGTSYLAYTRTSTDNVVWEEYKQISTDGSINSTMNRYVQVKIELSGGTGLFEDYIEDFSEGSNIKYDNTEYVVFDGNLKLKKDYVLDSSVSNHGEEGSIYVTRVEKSRLKKIDKLIVKEVK